MLSQQWVKLNENIGSNMTQKINTKLIDTTGATEGSALTYSSSGGLSWLEPAGGGVTTYATIAELPLSGNDDGSLAFVSGNNRLYIWNGAGWFNIALINTSPSITTGPDASYAFAVDGTPIVLTLVAQDPEGVPITWSYAVTAGSLGSTATVSQSDNVFTITPSTSEVDVGTFGITFTASDGINLATAASSFTLAFTALSNSLEFSVVEEENGTFTKSFAGTASTQSSSVDANGNSSIYDTVLINADGENIVYTGLSPYSFDATSNILVFAVRFITIAGNSVGIAMRDNGGNQVRIVTNINIKFIPASNLAYDMTTPFSVNKWYIISPESADPALANFKVKEVGGSVITVSQTGGGTGYTPPALAINNSFAVHSSGSPSGEQAGMSGYISRDTLPMEFAGLAIYSRSSFTNEQAMADFESGVFG